MKKIVLSSLVVGVLALSGCQSTQSSFYASGEKKEVAELNELNIKNGDFSQYFESGALKSKGAYVNGKKDGVETGYYETGEVKYYVTYKAGVLSGSATFFHENGNVSQRENYFKGKKDGFAYTYNKDGSLIRKESYLSDVLSGVVEEFYPSKKKIPGVANKYKRITEYRNGKPHGLDTKFSENGQLIPLSVVRWNNGMRDGQSVVYYETGERKLKRNFENDKLHGWQYSFHKNGELMRKDHYSEGVCDSSGCVTDVQTTKLSKSNAK